MTTRLERGIRIIESLQRGTRQSVSELAVMMKVSRRTIFRDIALLKELQIPITLDPKTSTYSCDCESPVLISRMLANADAAKSNLWTISKIQDAILNRRTLMLRELDPQQNPTESNIWPLELTLDHAGWRLVFRSLADTIPQNNPVATTSPSVVRSVAMLGGSPRVVILSQVQIEPV